MFERPYLDRYRTDANKSLIDAISDVALDWTYDEAWAFYKKIADYQPDGQDKWKVQACLGLIDRYYLMVVLMQGRHFVAGDDKGRRWLYARCREVERDPDGYLDLWAREHFKSTIITFGGCIQEILRDPEITIGIFANVQKVAHPFLAHIMREFSSNALLKGLYSDVLWARPEKEAPKWSVDDGIIVKRKGNPKEATVEAHGLIRGMPTGRHFRLRVYDDVVTRESVTNAEMIRATTEARELSDNLGSADGREWNVGTRYHFADTYGILLERGAVKPRIYAATANGRLDGVPVFFSQEKWDHKKKTQPSQIAAQMLQNPAAGNETTFDPAHLRGFEIRPRTLNVFILVDPSKGRTRNSDRTGIAVIGIDAHENKYLLDGYRHRMNLGERWRSVKALHRKWSNDPGTAVVTVCYESYGLQTDIEHFETMMRIEKYPFHIEEVSWAREGGQSKEDRVERLVPDFLNSRFYLPALVHHEVHGTATWRFDADQNAMIYAPLVGETKAQRGVIAIGQSYRVQKPVKRIDEEKTVYDLTRAFIEEYLFFPFGSHDDLIDTTARIYDAKPLPPLPQEQMNSADPTIYEDGV